MPEDIRRRFPHVDLVIGTHNRHKLPRLIEQVRPKKESLYAVWREAREIIEGLPVRRESKLSAWVPIRFGCDLPVQAGSNRVLAQMRRGFNPSQVGCKPGGGQVARGDQTAQQKSQQEAPGFIAPGASFLGASTVQGPFPPWPARIFPRAPRRRWVGFCRRHSPQWVMAGGGGGWGCGSGGGAGGAAAFRTVTAPVIT
ncbi:hypothetical protein [Thermodesulfitimonas sp.]